MGTVNTHCSLCDDGTETRATKAKTKSNQLRAILPVVLAVPGMCYTLLQGGGVSPKIPGQGVTATHEPGHGRQIGVLAIQTFFRDRAAVQAEIISLVALNLSGGFFSPSSSRLLKPSVEGKGK